MHNQQKPQQQTPTNGHTWLHTQVLGSWHNINHRTSQCNTHMDNDRDLHSLLNPHAHQPHHTNDTTYIGKRSARDTPEHRAHPEQTLPHKRCNQHTMPTKGPPTTTQHQHPAIYKTDTPTMVDLNATQSKYTSDFIGLVLPCSPTLEHPAAPMLVNFMTKGCDAAIDAQWTIDMIKAAIAHGAHPSALQPEPAMQLQAETLKMVKEGYAHLVAWDSIKQNPLPSLKISPITTTPHKSRGYRGFKNKVISWFQDSVETP